MEKYLLGAVVVFVGACCREPERSASSPPPPQAASRFPEVALNAPEVGPDGTVTLSWQVRDLPASIVKPQSCFIRIERRPAGGPWAVIADVPNSTAVMKYRDTDTQPKTHYEYRVTLGILDPAWTPAKPGRLTDRIYGPVAVRTPGIWSIQFSNILTFEDDNGAKHKPGQAYVTIRKYDRTYGLVEWKKIQHEGEALGVITENGLEVSKHRAVTKDGKFATVDFRTGGKIKRISTGKLVLYNYTKCVPQLKRDGTWECPDPTKLSASYKVNEVLYTDEDGKDQAFTTPDGPGPINDTLCPAHIGPPVPKAVMKEPTRQEIEGSKILAEADALWESTDAAELKKAQMRYKRLLESYSEHPVVVRRHAELSHRSRQRVD